MPCLHPRWGFSQHWSTFSSLFFPFKQPRDNDNLPIFASWWSFCFILSQKDDVTVTEPKVVVILSSISYKEKFVCTLSDISLLDSLPLHYLVPWLLALSLHSSWMYWFQSWFLYCLWWTSQLPLQSSCWMWNFCVSVHSQLTPISSQAKKFNSKLYFIRYRVSN